MSFSFTAASVLTNTKNNELLLLFLIDWINRTSLCVILVLESTHPSCNIEAPV